MEPAPDPTSFFNDFKDAKKKFAKVLFYNSALQAFFSPLNTFVRKGNDPDPNPYL